MFLFSDITRYSNIRHFSGKFWFRSVWNYISEQDTSASCAYCYWNIFASWSIQKTDLGKIGMYIYIQHTHMHTHTHTHTIEITTTNRDRGISYYINYIYINIIFSLSFLLSYTKVAYYILFAPCFFPLTLSPGNHSILVNRDFLLSCFYCCTVSILCI